jgi:hypothetical protein
VTQSSCILRLDLVEDRNSIDQRRSPIQFLTKGLSTKERLPYTSIVHASSSSSSAASSSSSSSLESAAFRSGLTTLFKWVIYPQSAWVRRVKKGSLSQTGCQRDKGDAGKTHKWDHGIYEVCDAVKTICGCDLGIAKFPTHREILQAQQFDVFVIGFVALSSSISLIWNHGKIKILWVQGVKWEYELTLGLVFNALSAFIPMN